MRGRPTPLHGQAPGTDEKTETQATSPIDTIPDFKPVLGSYWITVVSWGVSFLYDLRFPELINFEEINKCALSHCFFCSGRYSAVQSL
jgi:hypothetical protein